MDYNGELEELFSDHGHQLHFWDLSAKYADQFMLFASQPYANFRHNEDLDTFCLKIPSVITETFRTFPIQHQLEQNYLNSFNPEKIIIWKLLKVVQTDLNIYNIPGQKIVILVSQY